MMSIINYLISNLTFKKWVTLFSYLGLGYSPIARAAAVSEFDFILPGSDPLNARFECEALKYLSASSGSPRGNTAERGSHK